VGKQKLPVELEKKESHGAQCTWAREGPPPDRNRSRLSPSLLSTYWSTNGSWQLGSACLGAWNSQPRPALVLPPQETNMGFGRGLLLWLIGIPLPIILLLALFMHH
jgi:hypothetical protein